MYCENGVSAETSEHLATAFTFEVYFISVLGHRFWHVCHRKIYPICQ